MKTDIEIQHDVAAELAWEPSIDATQIHVAVQNGIVSLSGSVQHFAAKVTAEHAALRVYGVKSLVVAIQVQLPGLNKRSDQDIAKAAGQILRLSALLPYETIQVMVEDGWITLTGEVAWDYQRQGAAMALRDLHGVVGVKNDITLRPQVSSTVIKSEIEATLRRRNRLDEASIRVDVNGADVTLSGSVSSWSAREWGSHAAWGAPGVKHVMNNVLVS